MTLEELVDPRHLALLVVDVQNDFCAEGGYIARIFGVDESKTGIIADNIMALVSSAREKDVRVIWVKANYDPKYLLAPLLTKQANMQINDVCCGEGSWGQDFFRVRPIEGEIVLEKHRYSAFFETPLDSLLRKYEVQRLVLTGVATNVCIDSTARDGFFRGYHIIVPRDCVGSHDQELHEAALKNIDKLIGTICKSREIIDIWHRV